MPLLGSNSRHWSVIQDTFAEGKERNGKLDMIASIFVPFGRILPRFVASPHITLMVGCRRHKQLTKVCDCSIISSRSTEMPCFKSAEVTAPVPAPSSTISPLPFKGTCFAIIRASRAELGHTEPTVNGYRTNSQTNNALRDAMEIKDSLDFLLRKRFTSCCFPLRGLYKRYYIALYKRINVSQVFLFPESAFVKFE